MQIKFLGATTSVTGSCHLITTENHKLLLDCGLFQGSNELEQLNWEPFDFNPEEIECVLLSHAHIDHCGRIPLLVKRGFRGRIYCTDATADLLTIMLRDCASIMEKEAEWTNRKNMRAGGPLVEPLYTMADVEAALSLVTPVLYNQLIALNGSLKAVFNDAGHILGSAIIELFIQEGDDVTKLVYSGDLGMKGRPILRDPTFIKKADFVIMEATYGSRVHESNSDSIDKLIEIILKTVRRGGNVIIPSFAVGRTQELIYQLNRFYEGHSEYQKELSSIMVYVDSPMATSATEIFRRNAQVFDEETREYILRGDHPLDFKNLKFTRSVEESVALNHDQNPKIIISSSGMCEAGRIKHHLKHNLWNPKSSIVFVGYQAEGTLGRSIVKGDKRVTIFGEKIQVEAEIYNLEGFSGHADRDGLLEWVSGFQKKPGRIFLVHGEEEAKKAFAKTVKDALDIDCTVVRGNTEYTLSKDKVISAEEALDERISPEALRQIKSRISSIHDDLERILYHTHLAMGSDLSPQQIIEIGNIVMELEKHTLNLGSVVARKTG
ncbi:MBL fold metallo-hydrolase RNA specificity domain-containing protein [Thermoclostridium caenicola]|uniref:Metallo-beta-lactamase family protein n=1 Tax=Thermoclostridium caenicola TaxID=659425 RepID=A0A1M6DX50_9FIRM|nr:MBL fold metallo-hydrolase [Thermoclostridium caenicola]SHI77857.1 metallo-beta-lactamase family protein [Thermoclostridium caenicola]HOP72256.1 MBL fold metallo-hydrolase [Thermoclostridium caenicola]